MSATAKRATLWAWAISDDRHNYDFALADVASRVAWDNATRQFLLFSQAAVPPDQPVVTSGDIARIATASLGIPAHHIQGDLIPKQL